MSRSVTVVDVASAAGVSRQTVSNVLNAPQVVRPATRERVERAISALGYRPHAAARRLRTRRSATLAVRMQPMPDGVSGGVLDRFLHALVREAAERDLQVLLYAAADPADEVRQLARLVDSSDVDAVVLTSTAHDDPRTGWLLERGVPFVAFGRPWGLPAPQEAPFGWVDVDGRAGVREATRALLATGRRQVAFLGWPVGSGTGDDRRAGWRDALDGAEDGAGRGADALDLVCPEDVPAASRAVRAAVERGVPLDGLVCASDTLALGAHLALGDRLPVVGFDDSPVAAAVGLSSVAQPLDEAARAAVELLALGDEAADDASRHRLLRPEVVWRTGSGR